MRTTYQRLRCALLASAACLLLATNTFATTNGLSIGLNFGADEPAGGAGGTVAAATVAGAVPQANWNNLVGASGTASALVADTAGVGAATTASVTWSCPNTWSSTGRGEENNQFPAGGDRQMMIGYLDTDNAAGVVTVTVSGLGADIAGSTYDVVVYGLGGTSVNRWGAYSIGSVTQILNSAANPSGFVLDPGLSNTDNGNYAIFRGISGSSFTLVANAVTAFGNGTRAPVSAIQIVSRGSFPNVVNVGANKVGSVQDNGGGSVTVVGGGNDIWAENDNFTYNYGEITGDFDVQVRVDSFEPNARWSKAGLMARETLSEFSRYAFIRVAPPAVPTTSGGDGVNDTRFMYRTGLDNVNGGNGGEHEDIDAANPIPNPNYPNAWLRLVRSGNTMYSSNSLDGITWNYVSSQDTTAWGGGALSNKLFLGLAVSRHSGGPTAKAEFRNLKFNYTAPFAVADASSRGNPNGVRVSYNGQTGAGAQTAANYALVTLSGPNVTLVNGLRFTTANDSPARDPMTFTLEGTTGDPSAGPWTLIASGNTGLDTARFATAPDVTFANSTPYTAYRLLFPTVRDAAGANSMQISEIAFLDAGGNDVSAPGDAVLGVVAVAGDSQSAVAVAGTVGGQNNYPAAESPDLSVDNNSATKYLNFAKLNTGIIVTPAAGVLPPNPTVLGATQGPTVDTIQLTTSVLVEGATYELTVDNNNVQDSNAILLGNNTITFVHGAGYEARRIRVSHNKTQDGGYYRNSDAVAKGMGDVLMLGDGVFPPVQTNSVFEDPIPDTATNERFSTRISGVLVAPSTGNYTFYASSDDQGFLYLSSDETAVNKVQIANEPAWNGGREYISGGNQASRGDPAANISTPQTLVAGQKYYLEFVFTEGGGGNNGSATWLPPGGAPVANGTSPIPESFFAPSRLFDGAVFTRLGPVQIARAPANLTVTALLPATFSVKLDGTPGYTYQWSRNGAPIAGATGPSYTLPVAALTDDQAVFTVSVANEFSTATSAGAVLTVLNPQPPHLLGADADSTFAKVTVHYDNRVEVASAENIANYTISGGVTVNSAVRASNGRDVVLTTTAMAQDSSYTLTVGGIHDETGTTTIDPNPSSTTFQTLVFAPGYVIKEYYNSWAAGGGSVDSFIPAVRSGSTPLTLACMTNNFGMNEADQYENYGGHIKGYFVPPTDGAYTFYIATDDFGRLFLSTDENPANAVLIATEPVWSGRRTYVGEAGGGGRLTTASPSGGPQANISGAINLLAGQKYYIEGFFTEGGGGDNMDVAVKGPGDAEPVNGDLGIHGTQIGSYINAGQLIIDAQPQTVTRTENSVHSFSVVAHSTAALCGAGTLSYQWSANGTPIPGANSATLTVGPLTLADEGTVYSVVVSAPARSVTSADATLHISLDNVPPVLSTIKADTTLASIVLAWSEIMNSGPIIEAGNYTLKNSNGDDLSSTIASITADPNGSNVVLSLSTLLNPGSTYSLEIDYQQDLAGNGPVPTGMPAVDVDHGVVVSFSTPSLLAGYIRFETYGGGSGTAVSVLTSLPTYPNSPDLVRYINAMDSRIVYPGDGREQYGARMTGYYIPPADGDYTFHLRSDDASELWLSTDANPANLVKIAEETGCCGTFSKIASPSIPLVGGQRYYIQMLYREGGGGDFGQVAVRLTSDTVNPDTLTPISGSQIASLFDTTGASVTITQQPTSQSFAGATTPFTLDFNANDGGFYVQTPLPYSGPWHYDLVSGSWKEDGQGPETGHANTSILNTPALTVKANGSVVLSFDHRYSREGGEWDGAKLFISVNGGTFTAVPGTAFSLNGYNGSVLGNSSSVLHGQEAFVNDSPGVGAGTMITSVADLGTFVAGDVLRIQFLAGSDGNTAGSTVPNWEITSVGSPNLDSYPGTTTKTVSFTVGAKGTNALGDNQPLTYQWSRDDGSGFVAIAGATSATYSFAPSEADNGARFRATVTVAGASADSAIATLTVGTPASLSILRAGGQTVVVWTGACTLQESAALTSDGSGWGPSAVVNGVPFTPSANQKYFRLICP